MGLAVRAHARACKPESRPVLSFYRLHRCVAHGKIAQLSPGQHTMVPISSCSAKDRRMDDRLPDEPSPRVMTISLTRNGLLLVGSLVILIVVLVLALIYFPASPGSVAQQPVPTATVVIPTVPPLPTPKTIILVVTATPPISIPAAYPPPATAVAAANPYPAPGDSGRAAADAGNQPPGSGLLPTFSPSRETIQNDNAGAAPPPAPTEHESVVNQAPQPTALPTRTPAPSP